MCIRDRADIDVRLDTEATVESIRALQPDVVVLATGQQLASSARDTVTALAAPSAAPSTVVVLGGDLIGISIASFLADHGHSVTVLEPGKHFGLAMAMPRRWTAVYEARQKGVKMVREADVTDIGPDVDHVITTLLPEATDNPLLDALTGDGLECHMIGDAAGVGYIQGAMWGAHEVATAL